MHLIRKVNYVAAALAVACLMLGPAAAQNLLINGDFETGPYGDSANITGWMPVGADQTSLFQGIFDASWNNPPPVSTWPSNFGAQSGAYYLGRYFMIPPYEPGAGSLKGWVFQQVTGRIPGETLYGSLWLATHLPNGGGVRIGFDTDYVPDPLAVPPPGPTETTVWFPPVVNEVAGYAMSEGNYSKLQGSAPVGASGNMTLWVEYTTPDNSVADVQIVQVDNARLAATKSMEIRNIEVHGISPTIATIVFDTYDGGEPIVTTGMADYGLTDAYSLGTKTDTTVRFNHSVNLTGLVLNNTYHYRLRATAADYEQGATVDLTFKHVVGPAISGVADTATSDTATVTWTTDIDSDSTVSYGIAPDQFKYVASNPTMTKNHSVTLTGLMPNTQYFYRVTSCAQPPDGCRSLKSSLGVAFSVITDAGEFWNGDFEFSFNPTHTESEPIPGWVKITSNETWMPSGKWSVPAQSGGNYVGAISNGGKTSACLYQRFATTPGELLSYSAWVWAEGRALVGEGGVPEMIPHRFGEQYCKIGIDPTGGVNPNSPDVIWSSRRQTQSWRNFIVGDPVARLDGTGWEKIAVAAFAKGNSATILLAGDEVFPAGWNFHFFDNVGPEPITTVASVSAAKALANDTVIDLSPAAAADCPVVTYIANPNVDTGDNNGLPYFYIQDSAQPAAIKVTLADSLQDLPEWLEVGKKVRVKGAITWGVMKNRYGAQLDLQYRLDKPAGERAIRALTITDSGATGVIKPVAMTNKTANTGGTADAYFTNAGAAGAPGTHNTGILVRVVGKVTDFGITQEGVNYLVIDDGSVVTGYSGYPTQLDQTGLAVYTEIFDYSSLLGSYVEVTGIAGVRVDNDFEDPTYTFPGVSEAGKNIRWIKPVPNAEFMPSIRTID